MYTTLSPCEMCTGAAVLYKLARVVVGENKTFLGGEEYLKQRGIEVIALENQEGQDMMRAFIERKPEIWHEDIGV
ncbi:Cytosine deaminase [Lecanora helva]